METAEQTTYTMADFIAEHDLAMTAKRTNSNPNMDDSADMDHWACRIARTDDLTLAERNPREFWKSPPAMLEIVFSMGSGHNGKTPELADVLDCLASDTASVDNAQSFEDWATDLGYDEDSRRAERAFKACEEQAEDLKQILGSTDYETLLYETERL